MPRAPPRRPLLQSQPQLSPPVPVRLVQELRAPSAQSQPLASALALWPSPRLPAVLDMTANPPEVARVSVVQVELVALVVRVAQVPPVRIEFLTWVLMCRGNSACLLCL